MQAWRFLIGPENGISHAPFGPCFALSHGKGSERSHHGFHDHYSCEQLSFGGVYLFRRDSDMAGLEKLLDGLTCVTLGHVLANTFNVPKPSRIRRRPTVDHPFEQLWIETIPIEMADHGVDAPVLGIL